MRSVRRSRQARGLESCGEGTYVTQMPAKGRKQDHALIFGRQPISVNPGPDRPRTLATAPGLGGSRSRLATAQ